MTITQTSSVTTFAAQFAAGWGIDLPGFSPLRYAGNAPEHHVAHVMRSVSGSIFLR